MAFTYFFRDAESLELAVDQVLPAVHELDLIDIWDAGCAHGPEPYTLAMLCREKMAENVFRRVRIHATDVDRGFAAQVSEGIFQESELRRLPSGFREKYFSVVENSDKLKIVEEIRSKISFSHHDLLSLEPFCENCSLIVCKNVLLHFHEEQRCNVLRMFHETLRPGGVLVMEHTQKIPAALKDLFRPLVPHAQVFGKATPPSEILSRQDLPANHRRPNLWNHILCRKLENEGLERGANRTVRRLP